MTQKQMNDYHARNHKVNYISVHFIDPRLCSALLSLLLSLTLLLIHHINSFWEHFLKLSAVNIWLFRRNVNKQTREKLWHYLCFSMTVIFYEWQQILTKHTAMFSSAKNDFFFLKIYWFSIKNIWRLYLYFSLKNSIPFPAYIGLHGELFLSNFPRQWTFFFCVRTKRFFK